MFCKQCGSELKDGAVFCTNCGAKQTLETPQTAPVGQDSDLDKTVGVFGDFPGTDATNSTVEQSTPTAPQPQPQQPTYTPPVQQTYAPPVQQAPVVQPSYNPNPAVATSTKYQSQAIGSPSNGKVGFGEAVKLVFKNYANFTGRASKSEYWWGFLFLFAVGIVGYILSATVPPLGGLITLGFFLPNLSLNIRRLHDIGKAWYWLLMGLIPLAGFIILIVYYCKDSDGDNQWGPGLASVHQPASYGAVQNATNAFSQPAYTPAQPTSTPVNSTAPVAPAQKIITDNDIVDMAQNHEPVNLHTPEAKSMMDAAINKIIPTYTGTEDLASAMMQCNPQDIKDKIAASDTDTLLVIFKAIGYYIGIGADQNVLGLVQQNVLSTLKTRF